MFKKLFHFAFYLMMGLNFSTSEALAVDFMKKLEKRPFNITSEKEKEKVNNDYEVKNFEKLNFENIKTDMGLAIFLPFGLKNQTTNSELGSESCDFLDYMQSSYNKFKEGYVFIGNPRYGIYKLNVKKSEKYCINHSIVDYNLIWRIEKIEEQYFNTFKNSKKSIDEFLDKSLDNIIICILPENVLGKTDLLDSGKFDYKLKLKNSYFFGIKLLKDYDENNKKYLYEAIYKILSGEIESKSYSKGFNNSLTIHKGKF